MARRPLDGRFDDAKVQRIFAENLTRARERRGLSYAELGRRSGVHRVCIREYERCYYMPTLGNMVRLASALRVSLDELSGLVRLQVQAALSGQGESSGASKLGQGTGRRG